MSNRKLNFTSKAWIFAVLIIYFLTPALADTETTTNSPSANTNVDTSKGPTGAFIASFSTIVVSELGDKTFFIAAIMAMRYNRMAVLSGALFALFLMTGISTAFGLVVTNLIPPFYSFAITTALFFFFGFKLLWDAYHSEGGESNEKSEVEMELNQLHSKMMEKKNRGTLEQGMRKPSMDENENNSSYTTNTSMTEMRSNGNGNENGNIDLEAAPPKNCTQIEQVATKLVFWQALTLTFLGEWGDRSQISTIALAANNNAYLVFIGSFLGHCLCTGLAVMGGKYMAKSISEKKVNICGGVLFLIFALHNIFTETA